MISNTIRTITDQLSVEGAVAITMVLPQLLIVPCITKDKKTTLIAPFNGLKLFGLLKAEKAISDQINNHYVGPLSMAFTTSAIGYLELLASSKAHSTHKIAVSDMDVIVAKHAFLDDYIPTMTWPGFIFITSCELGGIAVQYYLNHYNQESHNITLQEDL